MSFFSPEYTYVLNPKKGIQVKLEDNLDKFNVDLLNIGDLKSPSKNIEVLSVVFDLEGFTNFTRQVDPQLTIPNFIFDFFNWLFNEIKQDIKDNEQENTLWAELPFFSKFMGDGVLFLWKIDMDKIVNIDGNLRYENLQEFIVNIISVMYDICKEYNSFFTTLNQKYVEPPSKLRCGIARGNVFPIGNGLDFVGPCINISNRLQKFNGLSFAFSARGIDGNFFHDSYKKYFVKKRVSIRGIGDNELIYIKKVEFEKLPENLKNSFYEI